MPRKRCSHDLHLHAPEQLKYHLTKRQRCKDPNEKCGRDMVTNGAEEFGFGSLNLDVMELVFNHLNDPVTRLRFSAVCRFWRWVAKCCRTPQFPWLMLEHSCKCNFFFFSLSDGTTHTLCLPGAQGMICCGSFEGWLVMQTSFRVKKEKIFLIDPLSKAKIHLPVTVINDSVNRQIVPVPPMLRVYLSSAPTSNDGANNNDCLVVAVDMDNNLYMCRLGDQSWTRQYIREAGRFSYDEIIFYNGSIIAIDCWAWERVNILELVLESDHHLILRANPLSLPLPLFGVYDSGRVDEFESFRSLIEWCGELYLVFHDCRSTGDHWETPALYVFKLDSRWNLVKVENIGDGGIFLGITVPKCFSVKDFPPSLNLKGNCIYNKEIWSNTTNIFCLKDGKWEPLPSLSSLGQIHRYVWYTPKILY